MWDWVDDKFVTEKKHRYFDDTWVGLWMYRRGRSYPTYMEAVFDRASKYKGWLNKKECKSIKKKFFDKYGGMRQQWDKIHSGWGYPTAVKICKLCGRPIELGYQWEETDEYFLVPIDRSTNDTELTKVHKCSESCREVKRHWEKVRNRAAHSRVWPWEYSGYLFVHILNTYLKQLIKDVSCQEKLKELQEV